jgi:hypothetical protein
MNSEWIIVGSSTSPDGTFRVEQLEDSEFNDRGGPYRRWRVVYGEELFDLPADLSGELKFDDSGKFSMDAYYYASYKVRIAIDPRRRTFALPWTGEAPLATLSTHIRKLYALAALATEKVRIRSIVWAFVFALLSFAFVLAGIFDLLYLAKKPRDLWVGWACIIFFGACMVDSLFEVWQQVRKRREALKAREELARLAGVNIEG